MYLTNSRQERVALTFKQIEDVLRFPLPESARRWRPWWANDRYHVQAKKGWLCAGYLVELVDFTREIVVFQRSLQQLTVQRSRVPSALSSKVRDASAFEELARKIMSQYFKTPLQRAVIPEIPKLFDFVSSDGQIVGDAKYMTLVRGKSLPPAKFSVIAEHAWFLEKTKAKKRFLVFGNDRRVPMKWLDKYRGLLQNVSFFFIDTAGKLEQLQ